MSYFDDMYINYTEEEWLEGFLENQKKEYLEKANTDKVSLVEYISVEHKAVVYNVALNAVVGRRSTPEETKNYVVKARKALQTFLAKELDGVNVIEKGLTMMSGYVHQTLASECKLKYIGKPDHHAWELGETYSVIEVGSWFHNTNELGYYITDKEYEGNDIDYGCFYPMGKLSEDFEVLNG